MSQKVIAYLRESNRHLPPGKLNGILLVCNPVTKIMAGEFCHSETEHMASNFRKDPHALRTGLHAA